MGVVLVLGGGGSVSFLALLLTPRSLRLKYPGSYHAVRKRRAWRERRRERRGGEAWREREVRPPEGKSREEPGEAEKRPGRAGKEQGREREAERERQGRGPLTVRRYCVVRTGVFQAERSWGEEESEKAD